MFGNSSWLFCFCSADVCKTFLFCEGCSVPILDKAQLAADKAIGSLKKSKHPIASKLWPSIKEKKDKLTASIKVVEDDMLTQPKEDKANSDMGKVQKALDILNKDIGLANSI